MVVWRDSVPDAGAVLSQLQLVDDHQKELWKVVGLATG